MMFFYLPRGRTMGVRKKLDTEDQDWETAQAALAAAQAMPGGPARIEALKRAGRMRFAATKNQFPALERENSPRSDGPPASLPPDAPTCRAWPTAFRSA